MSLVESIYAATSAFPREETYALTSQTRRAAASVPANIAEGQGRRLTKEFLYFLANARGSLLELDTHLELAVRLRYTTAEKHSSLLSQMHEVGKLLNGLMRSIQQSSV